MKLINYTKITLLIIILIISHRRAYNQTLTDYDGHVYQTITIGNQIWMAQNLRTTHYADGIPIEDGINFDFLTMESVMNNLDSTGYFFYYNNDISNTERFGCLYNWWAAVGNKNQGLYNPDIIQGVCPAGWHIPKIEEWYQLESEMGGNAYSKLLTGGSSGFNAVFGGVRDDLSNQFFGKDEMGPYISSSLEPDGYIMLFSFSKIDQMIYHWAHTKTCGYSVRCIQNQGTTIGSRLFNKKVGLSVFPNPLIQSTSIHIYFEKPEFVALTIFNATGLRIMNLGNHYYKEGAHEILWDTNELPGGLYFIKMQTKDFLETKKIILQKQGG